MEFHLKPKFHTEQNKLDNVSILIVLISSDISRSFAFNRFCLLIPLDLQRDGDLYTLFPSPPNHRRNIYSVTRLEDLILIKIVFEQIQCIIGFQVYKISDTKSCLDNSKLYRVFKEKVYFKCNLKLCDYSVYLSVIDRWSIVVRR